MKVTSYVFVLGVSILPLSTNFILENCSDSVIFSIVHVNIIQCGDVLIVPRFNRQLYSVKLTVGRTFVCMSQGRISILTS